MTNRLFILITSVFLLLTPTQAQDFSRLVAPDGTALHVENGPVELGRVEPGWFSAMWTLRPTGNGRMMIVNRYTGRYLVDGKGEVRTTDAQPSARSTGPQYWVRETLPGPDPSKVYLRHQTTGRYLTESGGKPFLSDSEKTVWTLGRVQPPPKAAQPRDYIRLRSVGNPQDYLHLENGRLELSPIKPGRLSARWEMNNSQARGLVISLENIHTGQYLVAQGNSVVAGNAHADAQGRSNGLWRVIGNRSDPSQKMLTKADTGQPLCLEKGRLYLGARGQDSPTLWIIEEPSKPAAAPPPKTYFRLLSGASPQAGVHVETGAPSCGSIQPGWFSAMWEVEERSSGRGRVLAFRNRWTGQFLRIENGRLTSGPEEVRRDGTGPHLWRAVGSDADPSQVSLRNLATGQYLRFFTKTGELGLNPSATSAETLWRVQQL